MAWLNNKISPQIAIERGWNTWEVFLSNWNLELAVPIDLNSLLFPNPAPQAAIPSAFSVAIGPNSTVDRCWLQYNPNIDVDTGTVFPTSYNVYKEKLLSIRSPINYPVPGNLTVRADFRCNAVEDFVADDGAGTLVPFEWNKVGVGPGVPPLLHLVFYLQPPSLIPTSRYPFVEGVTGAAGAGDKTLAAAFPCYGRRTINVVTQCTSGTPTVRIGLLSLGSTNESRFREYTQATLGPMAVNDIESTVIHPASNNSFLTLWVDGSSGAGSAYFQFEMVDQ